MLPPLKTADPATSASAPAAATSGAVAGEMPPSTSIWMGLRPIIALTRLILGFPFKVSNWAFGMSQIPPRDFILGTLVGVIPRVAAFIYCGSLMKNLTDLSGPDAASTPARRAVMIGGILLSVVGLAVMAFGARRVLARAAPSGTALGKR